MKKSVLIILIIAAGFLSLFIGAKSISPVDIFNLQEEEIRVLLISRIPRLLSILTAGMSLSVAGVIMQMVCGNRFISPTTGSTIEWARLGILSAVLIFPGASPLVKMLVAFAFAFGGTYLFVRLIEKIKLKDAAFVPLVGLLLGSVVGSFTTYIAYQRDLIQNITSWMQGSFAMVLKGRYELLYFGLPFLLLAIIYANRFTLVSLGKDVSTSLGVRYFSTVQLGLMIVAVITSIVVVTVGSIPFVGIIIPNIVRIYRGDNLEKSIIDIALIGGFFLLLCDILSRLIIYPFEIPIGVTVGVLGCVIFLALLNGRRAYEAA